MQNPLIIGHRGCRYPGTKENSSNAVIRALKEGVDAVELDVIKEYVHHPTIIEELIGYDFKKWAKKSETLEQVLKTLNNQCAVYIHIKRPISFSQAEKITDIINLNHSNKVVIGSFDSATLEHFRKLEPDWIINYHCFPFKRNIKKALEINADWIEAFSLFIPKNFIRLLKENNLKFVPSANEDYEKLLHYIKLGAHAVSTFKPGEFKKWLEKVQYSKMRIT